MKEITLKEATEQQIIDSIRRNPEDWTELDTYEQVNAAMVDNKWKELFEKQVKNWGDHDSVDWEEDGCIDFSSPKTEDAFRNYLECSMESLDALVGIDDLEIEVQDRGESYHIVFWTVNKGCSRKKYDEMWCSSYKKIEVE